MDYLSNYKLQKRMMVEINKDRKEYFKRYYQNNRNKLKNYSNQYYLDNRDEINKNRKGKQNKYYKKYYENNKEKYKKRLLIGDNKIKSNLASLKHYYKNRDEIREKRKRQYREKHPKKEPKRPPAKKKYIQNRFKTTHKVNINLNDYKFDADGNIILSFS